MPSGSIRCRGIIMTAKRSQITKLAILTSYILGHRIELLKRLHLNKQCFEKLSDIVKLQKRILCKSHDVIQIQSVPSKVGLVF